MQVICYLKIDAERYAAENYQFSIRPPPQCPHCQGQNTLWALGYYVRYLSRLGAGILNIRIRRFRCCQCAKTISLLPAFAHPYRLIQNQTFHRFAVGHTHCSDVQRFESLLKRYWLQFEKWIPEINKATGQILGRAPPLHKSEAWWCQITTHFGNPDLATLGLVEKHQITFFGRYHCHLPQPSLFESSSFL